MDEKGEKKERLRYLAASYWLYKTVYVVHIRLWELVKYWSARENGCNLYYSLILINVEAEHSLFDLSLHQAGI